MISGKYLIQLKVEIFIDHIHLLNDLGTTIISDEILKILSSKYNWKKKIKAVQYKKFFDLKLNQKI